MGLALRELAYKKLSCTQSPLATFSSKRRVECQNNGFAIPRARIWGLGLACVLEHELVKPRNHQLELEHPTRAVPCAPEWPIGQRGGRWCVVVGAFGVVVGAFGVVVCAFGVVVGAF